MVGYRIKKIVMLLVLGLVPGALYPFLIVWSGMMMGTAIFIAIAVLFVVITIRVLHHPLLTVIEGKGMMAGTFDSSGRVELFNVAYSNPPILEGKYKGKDIETIFDRSLVHDLILHDDKAVMQKAKVVDKEGKPVKEVEVLVLPERKDEYVFALEKRYPFFIFNKNLGVFLSKESLSNLEKNIFAKHLILELLRKTAELANYMRDFGRYVIEATKPRRLSLRELVRKWWFWFIIIIVLLYANILDYTVFPIIRILMNILTGI